MAQRGGPTPDDATTLALAGELLGAAVIVEEAPGVRPLPLHGTLVDESLHLLMIRRADGRTVRVPKAGARGRLFLGERALPLNGELLRTRPEDRIKRLLSRGRRSMQ